jgi:phosphoribosyl 1,2-cyclic phosphodiesterase
MQHSLQVRFHGVRGTTPTPVAANLGHGGNTPCVQILNPAHPETALLLDAGTGLHALGHELRQTPPTATHIFFSHFHWDHIQGLPVFLPLYEKSAHLHLHSTYSTDHLHRTLRLQHAAPYFPVDFNELPAKLTFHQTLACAQIDDLNLEPFALHHPGGSTGFRISNAHSAIVYATDHEPGNAAADDRLLAAARNADILILDAQYTPDEYTAHIGWGHGTWKHAAQIARAAGVKQLVLFHHDPHHDDDALQQIVAEARTHFPNTIAAAEQTRLVVSPSS